MERLQECNRYQLWQYRDQSDRGGETEANDALLKHMAQVLREERIQTHLELEEFEIKKTNTKLKGCLLDQNRKGKINTVSVGEKYNKVNQYSVVN